MTDVTPIRAAVASAKPVKPRARQAQRGGMGANGGPKTWDEEGMPPGCPVKPIGKRGTQCVFLDALDQLTMAGPRELGEAYLTDYFAGDTSYLQDYWPRFTAKGDLNGFSPEDARRCIQRECASRGIWDDMDSVRGRGAWRAEDGGLVYHCGDAVISAARIDDPGVFDRNVYPARGRIRRPLEFDARIPAAHDKTAAAWEIHGRFLTWNWRRGPLDARLYFGLMICGFLGGALDWRPSGWVTGEAGSGKTYLMKLRRDVMGPWSLNAADATSAGVFQHLEFDSIAVSLDEQESGSDNRKLDAMVELAREAASGDARLRGSAAHAGVSFKARSSFQFSSINMAPLKDQDMSRMAQLQLYPRSADAPGALWTRGEAAEWGRELLRVLMERWQRWDDTLNLYREALAHLGHDQRGQDTFGTLLAAADLALARNGFIVKDGPQDEDPHVEEIWAGLEPETMAEYADRTPNWLACARHLLSSRPRDWKVGGGAKASIGAQIFAYLDKHWRARGSEQVELAETNEILALGGVKLQYRDHNWGWELCVPNSHPQLTKIYEGSDWPGKPNAPGGWAGALKAGDPGVVRRVEERFTLDGQQHRGCALRVEEMMGLGDTLRRSSTKEE